ncbi:PP2C family protein-serine/threonine phosphatase [Streptomyces sp. NPDC059637]|uniref:PP2C family protein-serine/threonine phosphatase n=1 Tax=Streptomyces sp. NPDC059637 TaxID=3347752 RepID=UPI00367E113C
MSGVVEQFSAVAELVTGPMLLVAPDGVVLAANTPALRALGDGAGAGAGAARPLVGARLEELLECDGQVEGARPELPCPDGLREMLRACAASPGPVPMRIPLRASNGTPVHEWTGNRAAGPEEAVCLKAVFSTPAAQLRRLYGLTSSLASATSLRDVTAAVHRQVPGVVGARDALLALHIDRLVPVLERHDRRHAPAPPWADLDTPEGVEELDRFVERARAEGRLPYALPLHGYEGESLGVLQLALSAHPDADSLAHIESMSQLVTQAVARAGLFEHEHRLAQRLQVNLLPDLADLPGLTVAARYAPGSDQVAVGGDWYDLFPLAGGRVGMAIGDVAGHGLTEATEMAQLRSALRAIALDRGCAPGQVLAKLNDYVCTYLPGRTATACFLSYDPAAGTLHYANAGHMPPVLVDPEGRPRLLEGRSMLLGIPGAPEPGQHEEEVAPGATMLLYTDGLIERRDECLDDGLEFLTGITADTHLLAPDMLCRLLVDSHAEADWPDDRALMVVRFGQERAGRAPAQRAAGRGGTSRPARAGTGAPAGG